tara:strand:+ start:6278 stop:7096 length:819 start_codon:yes stop_codon:yes gene_type:complete
LGPNSKSISDAFIAARKSAKGLDHYPGTLPATLDEAYAIQDASIAAWPDRVVGWKIGLVTPEYRASSGAERLVGPIFSQLVHLARRGEIRPMPVFAEGFAAVEAEFVFCLGADVPADAPIDRDLALAVGGKLHVGVEIASSPFSGINDFGPICVVSDFGNNHGLIVGPEIPGWHAIDWSSLDARVEIDGELVGQTTADAIPGTPVGALEFILHLMRRRGIALKAGQYISTGAVTGVHSAPVGARSRVSFGRHGVIDLELTPALPLVMDAPQR